MKKFKFFLLLGCLISMLFAFIACDKQLKTPTGVKVDDNYIMTWTKVDDAYSYKIHVQNVEKKDDEHNWTTRKNSYSLTSLSEGDYEIRVKAISAGKDSVSASNWSAVFEFHKNYETGCVYTLINNGSEYEITKAGTATGKFTIEDEYRGKPVTRIANAAFKGNGEIVDVTVGKNVREIGDNAFYNCSKLEKVVLPAGLQTLGSSAFKLSSKLKEIVIPDQLKVLSDETFANCRSLATVKLGKSLETIGEKAFASCSVLTEIEIPDSVKTIGVSAFEKSTPNSKDEDVISGLKSITFGAGLETIGEKAFYQCRALKTLKFSEKSSLISIADEAFAECSSLETVVLPNGLDNLGKKVFYMATILSTVNLPESLTHVGELSFNATKIYVSAVEAGEKYIYVGNWLVGCTDALKSSTTRIQSQDFKTGTVGIADKVFTNWKELNYLQLPDSLKYIGNSAFSNCTGLGQVKTYKNQNGVMSIGDYAFFGCTSLNNLVLGEGLKRIGSYAFAQCKQLNNNTVTSIIPDSVESIGTEAFKDTALWKAAVGVVYAGDWVVGFNATSKDVDKGTVALKKEVRGIADYAFYQCAELQTITGLHNATYIGRGAFYQCSSLAQVSLNDRLTKIGDYAFYKCTSLFTVSFPRFLKEIGRSAFYKCETLNEIDLSKTEVETIGMYAFYNCFNVKKATLSADLTEIADYAFYKCASIETMIIPDTVKAIGNRAFYKNEGLLSLTIGNGVESIGEYAFNGCASLTSIDLPDSLKSVGKSAFYKCLSVETLTLGKGLENIGDYAFYGMDKITKLILPESLKAIGKYAFKGCNGLTSIIVKESVEKIGAHAFYGCKSATFYTDAKSIPSDWQARWNSSYRPVVWGVEFSEDGSYVDCLVMEENTLLNENALGGIVAPKREGHTFAGWATDSEREEVVYTADKLAEVPKGIKLYAVWTVGEEDVPEVAPDTSQEDSNENAA